MLPQHRHEDEDGGDEDQSESDLRDGTRGEGFDVSVGAMFVDFFVPAREGGEEEEANEGEDDGHDTNDLVSTKARGGGLGAKILT